MYHRSFGLLCLLCTPSYSSPTWKVHSIQDGNLDVRQIPGANTDGGSLGGTSSGSGDTVPEDIGNDTGNGMAGTSGALTGTLVDFSGLAQSADQNFSPGPVFSASTPPPPPVECDSAGQLLASCWDALNMGQYVSQWWEVNKGLCTTEGLTFTPCFLKRTLDYDLLCNTTSDSCHFHFYDLSAYPPSDAYLLYSIYELWSWFGNFKGYLLAGLLEVGSTPVSAEISKVCTEFCQTSFFDEIWRLTRD